MTRVTKPVRSGRRPTKRMDMSVLRELLRDRRVWGALGVVIKPDGDAEGGGGDTEHFEIVPGFAEAGAGDDTSGGGIRVGGVDISGYESIVDILVEVEIQPSRVHVTARLSGLGSGGGVIQIPNPGDEVALLLPDGELDHMPTIVGILSRAGVLHADTGGQGPAVNRVLIVSPEVLIHDGAGGAEPLVRKSEFDGHTHGPGSFTTPSAGGGGGPVTGTSSGAAAVDGTEVLKAK